MEIYTLNQAEAGLYDGGDESVAELYRSLKERFGRVSGSAGTEYAQTLTEVYHPDGFIVDIFAK